MRTVIALPDQAGVHGVLLGMRTQFCQSGLFGQALGERPDVEIRAANVVWNHGIDEGVEIVIAQGFEHALLFSRIGADVAGGKISCHNGKVKFGK